MTDFIEKQVSETDMPEYILKAIEHTFVPLAKDYDRLSDRDKMGAATSLDVILHLAKIMNLIDKEPEIRKITGRGNKLLITLDDQTVEVTSL